MTQIVDAAYEHGMFRPVTPAPLALSEGQQVRLVLETPPPEDVLSLASKVYAGLSEQDVSDEIETLFDLLRETLAIYPQWRTLKDNYAVCGKQMHDARLLAVMLVHGVTHMLPLNGTDFRRFSGITVIEP